MGGEVCLGELQVTREGQRNEPEPQPEPKRLAGFCIIANRGIRMLLPEAYPYGGTWVFYVIAPVILSGVVASLWWIVKGAIGVFGRTPRG